MMTTTVGLLVLAGVSAAGQPAPTRSTLASTPGFERNDGQLDAVVRYAATAARYRLFLTDDEAVFSMEADTSVRMRLLGARSAKLDGKTLLPGRFNYLRGPRERWHVNVPRFATVVARDVYPGIDRIFHADGTGLEYDFVVAPGADPGRIALAFTGGTPRLAADGSIAVDTRAGTLLQRPPIAYQDDGGRRRIDARYVVENDVVRVRIGAYDHARPLVIDPTIAYSTYLGGRDPDDAMAVAVDAAGSAYVVGQTCSPDFPSSHLGRAPLDSCDAFVTKLAPAGDALVYSTRIGGSADDSAEGVAVDTHGRAYVAGLTFSNDFPTHAPLQGVNQGNGDAFVLELDATGSSLLYATFLGGNGYDNARAIAVDANDKAYVVGTTESPNFPAVLAAIPTLPTAGALQHGFVAKLASGGGSLLFSTYLGGNGEDDAAAVAVEKNGGRAWVTGWTSSSNFPTVGAFQAVLAGREDAYVTAFTTAGTISFSSYLGGSGDDAGAGIALDAKGKAVITGRTTSANFPVRSPLQASLQGPSDAFVTRLSTAGLDVSTYLGGTQDDAGMGVALDGAGKIHVAGFTTSFDFPTVNGIFPYGGFEDAFVTALDPSGTTLVRSTFIGGGAADITEGLATSRAGDDFVVGLTFSTNFPTVNAYQAASASPNTSEAFVVKVTP